VDSKKLQQIVEGALLASGQPLTVDKLASLFDEESRPEREEIQAALEDVEADCKSRSYELKRTASGYRFQVRQELAPWISKLWDEKPKKYSRALLETLALIAYRQPITRGDIEQVRGVAVSSDIIRTLQDREWIRVVGHRDVPGRPALYATTRQFLDYFNLKNLDELPTLDEIRDLDDINVSFDLSPEIENESDEEDEQPRHSAQIVQLPTVDQADE
jgi:segregation and condensation protein B